MNKDNYIRLLEKENQEYFEKAIKSVKDCCCHEIPELNDEINELLDDLNDMQADWAADHLKTAKAHKADCYLSDMTIQEFERINEDLIAQRDRFRGIIRELKKEKYEMGMELEKLKKQLNDFAEAVE